jgi:heme-degrading monooxygenase HmoA
MYARLFMNKLGPNDRAAAENMADTATKIFRTSPGFMSVTFFMNEQAGDYGALSVWESKEALEAAVAKMQPIIQEKLGSLAKSPPTTGNYEVYEPKA